MVTQLIIITNEFDGSYDYDQITYPQPLVSHAIANVSFGDFRQLGIRRHHQLVVPVTNCPANDFAYHLDDCRTHVVPDHQVGHQYADND